MNIRELYIFDFDDTLVSSGANIRMVDKDGNTFRTMTSEEFADPSHPKHLQDSERKNERKRKTDYIC